MTRIHLHVFCQERKKRYDVQPKVSPKQIQHIPCSPAKNHTNHTPQNCNRTVPMPFHQTLRRGHLPSNVSTFNGNTLGQPLTNTFAPRKKASERHETLWQPKIYVPRIMCECDITVSDRPINRSFTKRTSKCFD